MNAYTVVYKRAQRFKIMIIFTMLQPNVNLTADHLYEEAFNIKHEWEKFLPKEVFRYHNLILKKCNAPVDLQMGTIYTLCSKLCGSNTKGVFLTQPSCLNLFWIIVGASGAGKSQSHKHFITEPLKYVLNSGRLGLPDFEISKFTRVSKIYIYLKLNYLTLIPFICLTIHNDPTSM